MKLKKAIELIRADIDNEAVDWDSPLGQAYQLSFEAIKRVLDQRNPNGWLGDAKLPGETKD